MFPTQSVLDYLAPAATSLREVSAGIWQWETAQGGSTLLVSDVANRTADGRTIRQVVSGQHEDGVLNAASAVLFEKYGETKLAENLCRLNQDTTIGASLFDDEMPPKVRFLTKVSIFEGDDASANLVYAPFIATQAAYQHWQVEMLVSGVGSLDAESCVLAYSDDAHPHSPEAFNDAAQLCVPRLGYGQAHGQQLTIEFPWDEGAISHSFKAPEMQDFLRTQGWEDSQIQAAGGRTSLLTIKNDRHRLWGNGLLAQLELPVDLNFGEGAFVNLNHLNRIEFDTIDAPPMFGAWTLSPMLNPCFKSFFPNQYSSAVPGLVVNLCAWSQQRAFKAKDWVRALESRGSQPGD